MMSDITIGLIGLGKISQTHLAALEGIPGVDVIGGYDPLADSTLKFRGKERPVFSSLGNLLTTVPSTIIIGTPTPTHYEVWREISRYSIPIRVLIEKPIALSINAVDQILAGHQESASIGLYHAAHAPEVLWAAKRIVEWRARFGRILSYNAYFADPYGIGHSVYTDSLVNSWIDSGINALSVALRFIDLVAVDSVSPTDDMRSGFEARLRLREDKSDVDGNIRTEWNVAEPAKTTDLTFADGTCLHLNHQTVAGTLTGNSGIIEDFHYSGVQPRLVAHYFNAFSSLFVDRTGYYSSEQSALLHRLLLSSAP